MRGKAAKPRVVAPDAKYGSQLVSKFVNRVMQDGKKEKAFGIIYKAMDVLSQKTKVEPLQALEMAIENIKPKVEVRSRRVGGANYQVPVPVSDRRQLALALKWITVAARESRKGKSLADQLGDILIQSFNKEGAAYKKKEDTLRMADANKAFAQFTW